MTSQCLEIALDSAIKKPEYRETMFWFLYRKVLEQRLRVKIGKLDDYRNLAKNLEISCYNKTIDLAIYRGISRDWDCPEFINTFGIVCGTVLTHLDIASEHMEDYVNFVNQALYKIDPSKSQKIQDMINYRQTVKTVQKIVNEYCKVCGKSEATIHEQQKRSCDEPPTRRFECIHCGNVWNRND